MGIISLQFHQGIFLASVPLCNDSFFFFNQRNELNLRRVVQSCIYDEIIIQYNWEENYYFCFVHPMAEEEEIN